MDKSLKNIKKKFKKQGIYYTPIRLAKYLLEFVDVEYKNVYDPTCGRGNLLSVIDDSVNKYGQELEKEDIDIAKDAIKNFTGHHGDTLVSPAFMNMKFDFIFANPPFSIKWEPNETDIRFKNAPCVPPPSKADYAFILHILHLLSDKGIAIVICFPGVCYRKAREGKIRRWLIEQNYIDKVINIDGKTFIDTDVSTVALVFKKNKTHTDIEFINDTIEKRRMVSFEEIKENDFILSISNYVEEDVVEDVVNPLELELSARKAMLNELKRSIEFSIMVAKFEKIDPLDFINDILNVVNEYKEDLIGKKEI